MKWNKKDAPGALVKEIAEKYGCDLITASILVRRGITKSGDLLYFLEDDKRYMRNPFDLPGMEDTVERILEAKEEGEKVLVFGDRDTDGITSLVIVTGFLQKMGIDASWRLPLGDEPYGLSIEAVEEAAKNYISLIITVDCGISNLNEIKRAGELGIDVLVTDHHKPPEVLPPAYAVIDPWLTKDGGFLYPFQELAGCAVAYKLTSALSFALKSNFYGEPLCFLNVEPANNDTFLIEILKTRNLSVTDTLSLPITPGALKITATKLPSFLQGEQIFVYDAPAQKKLLEKIFGRGVDFGLFDCAPLIAGEIPNLAGKSLLRLREISRFALFSSKPLSEVGVLFNLFVSFVHRKEKFLADCDEDLQLAAVGTIADLMPLLDENRIIVRSGIASILKKTRCGISDLIYKLNLKNAKLSATDISWQLAPLINSAGRLGRADVPARLFLEKDPKIRDGLTAVIAKLNDERRALADETWLKVAGRAASGLENFHNRLAFASGADIVRGVTGVMASRLTGKFRLPSVVLSLTDDVVTGSMRSPQGYGLDGILELGSDLFIDSGGHDYAAGFSLKTGNLDEFLERLKNFSAAIEIQPESGIIEIDAEIPPKYLNPELINVVDKLEPFGKGNSELNFLTRSLRIADINFVGKIESKHAKFTLDTGQYKWPALYWRAADKTGEEFKTGDLADVIYSVRRNFFNGEKTLQLIITDMKKSAA